MAKHDETTTWKIGHGVVATAGPLLKEPDYAQGLLAGHGVGMAVERARIRRAIAPALRHLDSVAGTLERNNWPGAADMIRDDIKAIDATTRAPRPARAKGKKS